MMVTLKIINMISVDICYALSSLEQFRKRLSNDDVVFRKERALWDGIQ